MTRTQEAVADFGSALLGAVHPSDGSGEIMMKDPSGKSVGRSMDEPLRPGSRVVAAKYEHN
ncbi:MAG: hypothetical protein SFW65_06660 [Alphaproteobacteria bacterium]|nr:hypothetical protein [Alphaproteobacteria bacterium]